MKIAVIVSDFIAAANVGGVVETTVRTFDMPDDVATFVRNHSGQWSTITLGIERDDDTEASP